MPNTPQPTAHALRNHYRDQQANTARLRLLSDAGQVLTTSPNSAAIPAILGYALEFCAFESGTVMVADNGALGVEASRGDVLPGGLRFSAQGTLAAALKPDANLMVRQNSVSRMLLPAGAMASLELLLPLRAAGNPVGILQLVNRKPIPVPVEADLQALSTLASMLALALSSALSLPASNLQASSKQSKALSQQLTPREREVLVLLPHGLTNADIGLRLGIATGTVKVHVERIIHKLGLNDRTQVAARAVELGFGNSGAT